MATDPTSVDDVLTALESQGYVSDRSLAVAVHLALEMGRPLFLEGEAGVGKTEVAKVLAAVLETPLIRLQCYEGLDVAQALYEWDYARQMLEIRLLEVREGRVSARDIMTRDFLLARPLLQAVEASTNGHRPVLLIDELDRADEEFEAFLLELLSDFQVTIPEIGTIRAEEPPVVVITSNRTREIHDALKRRCIYHWIDYPDFEREVAILATKAPEVSSDLAHELARAMERLRGMGLFKPPGVAETLDWAAALGVLQRQHLDSDAIEETLGVVLKYQEDIAKVAEAGAEQLIS
ncbi:MAG: MoxR family ATPase [Acidimicrobiia bacterium]|nr:MoxR family ATPase [Acidimicrobiia bacterium]MBT8251054.1 MoxR family ATPase [Acidimicrobiia bacterium]NND13244.1 MoxR family ATPase [Acidimicrobiia bacterium]NNL29220.1 MoxR family ATPase [Acidimicrobiia bacterium]NNL47739.1 MoxR family ATPase [Acidimicrobiia bacterium]